MNRTVALFCLFLGASLVGLPFVMAGPGFVPVVARYKGGPVDNGGSIKGTVTVAAPPTVEDLAIGKDEKVCASAAKSPRLVLDPETKGLGNVVVYLEEIEKGKPNPKGVEVLIDQKGCQYTPHVTIVPMRSKVKFGSSDPILHNVHVYKSSPDDPHDKSRTVLNTAMKDDKVPDVPLGRRIMRRPGFYYVRCDAGHIWMSAYVWVTEHPYYALTDEKGNFELTDVPAGTYTLKFWHENWNAQAVTKDGTVSDYTYGKPFTHTAKVTVKSGEAVVVNWEVPAP